ncbi:MAG: hypothetical protein LBF09_07250 [Odoribacteraceae bacterium]|nr:hypothetical protein [Odoribacteraceae bacterium]
MKEVVGKVKEVVGKVKEVVGKVKEVAGKVNGIADQRGKLSRGLGGYCPPGLVRVKGGVKFPRPRDPVGIFLLVFLIV